MNEKLLHKETYMNLMMSNLAFLQFWFFQDFCLNVFVSEILVLLIDAKIFLLFSAFLGWISSQCLITILTFRVLSCFLYSFDMQRWDTEMDFIFWIHQYLSLVISMVSYFLLFYSVACVWFFPISITVCQFSFCHSLLCV